MKIQPSHLAVTILAVLAAVTAASARLGDPPGPATDLPAGPDSCCIGLAHRAFGSGLSCAAEAQAALAEGVRRLRLPAACAETDIPAATNPGDLLILANRGGTCRVVARRRLPAAQRLVAGVGLHLNRDPAEALELLPGIGSVRAQAIVESREREGPFESIEQLSRVRGIGARTVARLRPWLVPLAAAGSER